MVDLGEQREMEMMSDDDHARAIVMWLSEPLSWMMASRASLHELKPSARCADHVSPDMAWQLNIFRIEIPGDIDREWAPTICMVPEELKKGDDNGCYDPVAVRIGLCRGLPVAEELENGDNHVPIRGKETTLNVRTTEELWKQLPKGHRDLERYKSSCVVQLFVSRPRPHKKPAQIMGKFFISMRNRCQDIKKCHSNPSVYPYLYETLELETLRTLLIDGCFILHRLLKYAHLADREAAAKKTTQRQVSEGGRQEDDGWNWWIQSGSRCFAFVWRLMSRETFDGCCFAAQSPVSGVASNMVRVGSRHTVKTSAPAPRPALAVQGTGQGSKELDDDDYGDDDWSQTRGRCFVWQLVTRDLLLLENQIPFFVLRDLFGELKKDGESDETLVKGGLMLFRALCPQMLPEKDSISVPDPDDVHHLLHLFYLLVGGKELEHSAGAAGDNNDKEPRGLTDDVLPSELPQWIPGAKELLDAGIRLRKRKNAASFLDIKFDSRGGVLEIPPLQLYDYSEPVFRNMIAFEQTYPRTQFHVSTYSVFMNCLVSTAEDARILHLRGILVNMMNGGDQDGGRHFFDRICSHVHFPSDNYLVGTMAGVNKYIQSRHHRWRAALVRDYFSNPWVAISVGAAVFLLCLTVLQTFFTVYPYFKPSK